MLTLPQLQITEPGRAERIVAVRESMTIGRAHENDIVLHEASVSRCHVVLVRDAVGVLLLDLESTNGTLVNGVPALPEEPVRLADGDVIQLGQVVARYIASPGPAPAADAVYARKRAPFAATTTAKHELRGSRTRSGCYNA